MNTFEILYNKYLNISKIGFLKAVSNNKNSCGPTIEKLLGSTGGDFNIPDFYDIEIKAIRKYKFAEFDLFNSSPDGKYVTPSQWLSENYGYPDKSFKNIKVFKGNIYANKINKIGLFYKFKLKVDRNEKKIILNIYNLKNTLINCDIYWDFDSLKEKLERKLKKLAIFGFEKKYINNDLYYHFNTLNMYKLTNFNNFLNCVENGTIFVTFKTGVYKKGKYTGKFTDHGTSFRICKNNITELFTEQKF